MLFREDKLWIEVDATTGTNSVEVVLGQSAPAPGELPESILHTVTRTRQRDPR